MTEEMLLKLLCDKYESLAAEYTELKAQYDAVQAKYDELNARADELDARASKADPKREAKLAKMREYSRKYRKGEVGHNGHRKKY